MSGELQDGFWIAADEAYTVRVTTGWSRGGTVTGLRVQRLIESMGL
jgi:hypothetical protein